MCPIEGLQRANQQGDLKNIRDVGKQGGKEGGMEDRKGRKWITVCPEVSEDICGIITSTILKYWFSHQTETSGKRLREATPRSGKHDISRIQILLVEDVQARTESQLSRKNYLSWKWSLVCFSSKIKTD